MQHRSAPTVNVLVLVAEEGCMPAAKTLAFGTPSLEELSPQCVCSDSRGC